MQDERARVEMEGQLGHDADDQHETGKEDTCRTVVAEFEKLGDGIDAGAKVVREEERAGDSQADAGGELDGAGGQPVAVRVAGEADKMLCADVGGEERRAHEGPAEPTAGEEKLGASNRRRACARR